MSTVFIGGSRQIISLPLEIKKRLDRMISNGHRIIVGDANGADKAVQKHFHDAAYENVTVFCSGDKCRNNLSNWESCKVQVPKHIKGFQFYAAKDREMASRADIGLMIWDGKSAGTALNILRLIRAGKIAVLFNVPTERAINIKSAGDWVCFLDQCSAELRHDLQARATTTEWEASRQSTFSEVVEAEMIPVASRDAAEAKSKNSDEWTIVLNMALATGSPAAVVDVLGSLAKNPSTNQTTQISDLAREILHKALDSNPNPELGTVMDVLSSMGLRLMAGRARD